MDPVIASVGGLHDGLVKIGVGDDPLKPLFCQVHVGVTFVVVPVAVVVERDVDVSCFTKGVLAGVCSSNFDVELVASVTTTNDDLLVGESPEGFKTLFAELNQGWNEL